MKIKIKGFDKKKVSFFSCEDLLLKMSHILTKQFGFEHNGESDQPGHLLSLIVHINLFITRFVITLFWI